MIFETTMLAASVGGRWRPGIGDPTIMGWVTVAAYLVAALGCGLAAWCEPDFDGSRRPRSRPSRFWLALTTLLVALGINKQLDLQTFVTQVGRDTINAWGCYSASRVPARVHRRGGAGLRRCPGGVPLGRAAG